MAAKDPTAIGFKQIKIPNGGASVEITPSLAKLIAGDGNGVVVDKNTGTTIVGDTISLFTAPEDIKIMGIFALNPMSYLPGAPAIRLSPPLNGIKALKSVIIEMEKILSGGGFI